MNVYFSIKLDPPDPNDKFRVSVYNLIQHLNEINKYDYDGVAETQIAEVAKYWKENK